MSYKKESLDNLLVLIKDIINKQENEWFQLKLGELLFLNKTDSLDYKTPASLENKLSLIQEYLSIDVNNLIDYSEIEEPVREQLFRDCLEMCRFEKGTNNHKKNFSDFCRYAHLQLEELFNYYYIKKYINIEKILQSITKFNVKYQPKEMPISITNISFAIKMNALVNELNFTNKQKQNLKFLNDIRNEMSHRSTLTKSNEDIILDTFHNTFPNYAIKSFVEFATLSIEEQKIFNSGNFIITKRKENYTQIKELIENIKVTLLNSLNQY
jgi:hypothetical protein